jgi:tetratricopeptide (TPR) repeat protein
VADRGSGRGNGRREPKQAPRVAARSAGAGGDSLYERYKDALRRGHVAALRDRLDAAIDAYGEASTIAPDRPLPHSAIGGILARLGRHADALAAYDRAMALAPRDESALRGRADALTELDRRVEAADALDRLSEVLDAGGRLPDASDAARRALELAESKDRRRHVEALAGRLRETVGDEAAERALAQVLRLLEPPTAVAQPEPEPEPPDPIAVGAAAETALDAGDVDAARDGFLAAARGHRAAGRSTAAIDACYLALAVAPADPDLHLLLAELYIEHGWRGPALDKLLLLSRLASLTDDEATKGRLCALATEHFPNESALATICDSSPDDPSGVAAEPGVAPA